MGFNNMRWSYRLHWKHIVFKSRKLKKKKKIETTGMKIKN